MRVAVATMFLAGVAVVGSSAQRATTPAPARGRASRITTTVECAAELGVGVKSRRPFCDVLVATSPATSVAMTIPAHSGVATLQFDLHNRFTIPALAVPGPLAYARHEAVVAIIRATGEVLGQAAVVGEYRSTQDLFDQIAGGARPGGVKAIAPGPAQPIRLRLPAGVTSVGVVGTRLKVTRRTGDEKFDAPGAPVAIVSNLRIEYTPTR